MPELKNFKPNPDVPYYIPCMLPLICEKIRHSGSHCSLSLMTNLQFQGLPTYSVDHFSKTSRMDSSQTAGLLGYPDYHYYFGLEFETMEYPTLKEGLAAISRQISKGQPVIISGTTFFLPYTKDYQSSVYLESYPHPIFGISDHWLAVTGIKDQQVLVFDPVPNKYSGPISYHDFEHFWCGNRGIPKLQIVPGIHKLKYYGALQIFMRKKLKRRAAEKLHLAALKTISSEFLKGTKIADTKRAYYFGLQAAIRLKEEFLQTLTDSSNEEVLTGYRQCFFDLRFSRYYFRDLLLDVTQLYNLPRDYLESYMSIVTKWETTSFCVTKSLDSREFDPEKIYKMLEMMEEVIQIEKAFQEHLLCFVETLDVVKLLPAQVEDGNTLF